MRTEIAFVIRAAVDDGCGEWVRACWTTFLCDIARRPGSSQSTQIPAAISGKTCFTGSMFREFLSNAFSGFDRKLCGFPSVTSAFSKISTPMQIALRINHDVAYESRVKPINQVVLEDGFCPTLA
jgi:hypothetical protein